METALLSADNDIILIKILCDAKNVKQKKTMNFKKIFDLFKNEY